MKNSMLKMALIVCVLFTSVAVSAQRGERPDPATQAKTTVDAWQKALGLTDDQKAEAYKVVLSSIEKRTKTFQELRDNGGGREEMMEAFTKMQEDTDKELKKVFTEAQWPKYEAWKKENMQRRRGNRGGN